jgi:hypothetical protein
VNATVDIDALATAGSASDDGTRGICMSWAFAIRCCCGPRPPDVMVDNVTQLAALFA